MKTDDRTLNESQGEAPGLLPMANSATDAMITTDEHSRIRFWNPAAERIFGWKREEIVGEPLTRLIPKRMRDEHLAAMEDLAADEKREQQGRVTEVTGLRKDGSEFPLELSISAWKMAGLRYLSTIARDITKRLESETRLRQLSQAVEQSPASVVITDPHGNIEYVNPKFERLTGYTLEEMIGKNPRMLKSGHTTDERYGEMWDTVLKGGEWRGEFHNKKKGGELYWESAVISAIKAPDGTITHLLAVKEDITLRKAYEERLQHQCNHDALTNLPNRGLAADRLSQALAQNRRTGSKLAVMFVDLDDFKTVNDTLGHSAGDALLLAAADRLTTCFREGDTVARFGGDEFLVILPDFDPASYPDQISRRVLDAFAAPFSLEGREVAITVSIGLTLSPDDGLQVSTLVRNADAAMYKAKQAGRNTFSYFTPEMNEQSQRRRIVEASLRGAREAGELQVQLQPIVAVSSGLIIGADASFRWDSLRLGLVPREQFVPVAEHMGIMAELSESLLREACGAASSWTAAPELRLSVKLYPSHMLAPDFLATLAGILRETRFSARNLEFDLSERLLSTRDEAAIRHLMNQLHQLGVHLCLDDFGTGHTELSRLKDLPLHGLRIGREFMLDIKHDGDGAALVSAMIGMARGLDLEILAEGVETQEQLAFLCERHCDFVQGDMFGPPVSIRAFATLLASQSSDPQDRARKREARTTNGDRCVRRRKQV